MSLELNTCFLKALAPASGLSQSPSSRSSDASSLLLLAPLCSPSSSPAEIPYSWTRHGTVRSKYVFLVASPSQV